MIDPGEVAGMRRLFGTVLVQGIIDALSPVREKGPRDGAKLRWDGSVARKYGRAEQLADAIQWLNSEDFELISMCAGMSPTFLRDNILPLVDAPKEVRAAFVRRLESKHWNTDPKRMAAAQRAREDVAA